MKSATFPPLRVTPELRQDAESVLRDGESLSGFVEDSLRRQIEHRKMQREFLIEDEGAVTVLAVPHQREDDYL